MPFTRTDERERETLASLEQEEAGPSTKQRGLEVVAPESLEHGRPHQRFVESEARKYWQEISHTGSLTKPSGQEIRAAAVPILCQALRNRRDNRRHQAVNAMYTHASLRRWIKPPYSKPAGYASYIDALCQLADDASWLATEIPFPAHPPPRHPAVFYTIDEVSGQPVPREDSYILGRYVYSKPLGHRISNADRITPAGITINCPNLGSDSWFTLTPGQTGMEVEIYWLGSAGFNVHRELLNNLVFSPYPPGLQLSGWSAVLGRLAVKTSWLPVLALGGTIIYLLHRYL